MNDNTKNIKEVIREKLERPDKNGRPFLVLKLNNDEVIFVFSSNVKEDRWTWLNEGQEYNFKVKEGINGSNLLVDFEIEVNP